jgi:TonB family protein
MGTPGTGTRAPRRMYPQGLPDGRGRFRFGAAHGSRENVAGTKDEKPQSLGQQTRELRPCLLHGPLVPPSPPPRAIVITGRVTQYIDVVASDPGSTQMLELKPRPTVPPSQARVSLESSQPRKLILALALLLVALLVVLVTDRQFWFGSSQLILDSDGSETEVAPSAKTAQPASNPSQPAPAAAIAAKKHLAASPSSQPKTEQTPAVVTTRTVLPPMDVEVVAGDTHRKLHPATGSSKLEITHSEANAQTQPTGNLGVANNAAERERIADANPSAPSYPLLAQHMNVQGSVVLQAIIGADGVVQDLRVLAGPSILAAAAQQAVREWRFKPVLQNGQPVETKAKITVNFTINVSDGSAKTTLADSRYDGIRILSR